MDTITETKKDIIKRFAYNIYLQKLRDGFESNALENWCEAEEEYLHYERLHNGGEI